DAGLLDARVLEHQLRHGDALGVHDGRVVRTHELRPRLAGRAVAARQRGRRTRVEHGGEQQRCPEEPGPATHLHGPTLPVRWTSLEDAVAFETRKTLRPMAAAPAT